MGPVGKGVLKLEGGRSEAGVSWLIIPRMVSTSRLEVSVDQCPCQSTKVERSAGALPRRRRLGEVESHARVDERVLFLPVQVMTLVACGRVESGTQMKAWFTSSWE